MISLSNGKIKQHMDILKEYMKSNQGAALIFEDYMRKVLTQEYEELKPEYPRVVKLPKSLPELLEGDFEPEREIVLTEVPRIKDIPVWFNDSTPGVYLRLGYENGDSRMPCKQRLDDKDIHGMLAGMTGMGKSVTLNDIILGMCFDYAPWDLDLILCDPKIVEFKAYALNPTPPAVSSIAATTDADYIVSVLEAKHAEMLKRSSYFAKAGCKKIQEFRKKTGLAIPQVVIVIDEMQTMFLNAKRKSTRIEELLMDFSKLGRALGFHIILASQEIGSELSGSVFNQIGVRMALGCAPDVSEKILGNDEAKTIRQKGRLFLNTNPNGKSKAENRLFRVPYEPDDALIEHMGLLKALGAKYRFNRDLKFYDEDDVMRESKYSRYLENFPVNKNEIILGEPSFVMDGDAYKLKFDGNDVENIAVLCSDVAEQVRYCKMLKYNFLRQSPRDVQHLVLYNDPLAFKEIGLDELNGYSYKIKNVQDVYFNAFINKINLRRIVLEADELVFNNPIFDDNSDTVFQELVTDMPEIDNEINRSRVYYMLDLLLGSYGEIMGTGAITMSISDAEVEAIKQRRITKLKGLFGVIKECNCLGSRVTVDKMSNYFVWLIGLNRTIGFGRGYKDRDVKQLLNAFQDSFEVNVRFIITLTEMGSATDFIDTIKYYFLVKTDTKNVSRTKCETFPDTVSKVLGVVFENSGIKECYKFKKMLGDKEN